jgi:hypothetical protein
MAATLRCRWLAGTAPHSSCRRCRHSGRPSHVKSWLHAERLQDQRLVLDATMRSGEVIGAARDGTLHKGRTSALEAIYVVRLLHRE